MPNTGNTQQQINYGAAANDGQGDPLRTAFIKTDDNFDNVWLAGPVGSNITIANNTVQVNNTNGNLVLSPNGIGVIQTNSRVVPRLNNTYDLGAANLTYRSAYIGSGGLSVAGNLSVAGALSAANLSIAGNVTFPADVVIAGNLTVNGETVIVNVSNLVIEDKTIVLANGTPNAAAANGAGIIVDGANASILYNSTANIWTMNIGLDVNGLQTTDSFAVVTNGFSWFIGGNVLATPNGGTWYSDTNGNDEYISSAFDGFISMSALYASGNIGSQLDLEHGQLKINVHDYNDNFYTWQFGRALPDGVVPDLITPGNVLPGASNVYSLGNATNQWNDLYVSNTTIFMNNVPLSLTAGNVLTVNGNAVLQNNSNSSISTTGNITAGNIGITGGSLTWANASIVQTSSSDLSITGDGQVTVRSLDGTYQWTFDSNGTLTLPGATDGETIATQSGYITVGNLLIGQGGALFNSNNDSWALYGNLSDPGTAIFIPSDADAGNGIPLYLENQISNVEIRSGSSTWNFGNTSNLTLPSGGIVYETSIPGAALTGNTIALKPQGGIDADQQLLIYPTAVPGTDDNHLHLTTGNLYNTELFLGNDNLYVKLANTGNIVVNSNDDVGNTAQWTFDTFGTLTLPGGSRLRSLGANLDIFAGTGSYVNLITSDESSSMGVDNSGGFITTAGGTWDFDTTGNLTAPGNVSAVGNVSGAYVKGNGSELTNLPVPSVAQDITSTGDMSIMTYDGNLKYVSYATVEPASGNIKAGNISATGNVSGNFFIGNGSQLTGIAASYGNANVATFLAAYGSNTISTTGNITAGNLIGNISITGNVVGTQPNVTLVAGSYDWTFDNTGNLTLPGNTFAVNYADNTPVDVVTRLEGTWTVTAGNNNYSFTVPGGNTYQMWVQGNIPNGIIVWNATVSVSNTNVPVIGQQFAWNYEGAGNPIMLTSIPAQIIGTSGAISNASPAVGNTTNVFTFGINNTSGSNQTVRYGWIQIS